MAQTFKNEQLTFSRVKKAQQEKEEFIDSLLSLKSINKEQLEIFIRVFKKEEILEVWGKNKLDTTFSFLISYPFCGNSGVLGPKRKQGDLQIPEGVYFIDRFNPWSNFHLSLGVNYPNKSDKILGEKRNLGGGIFLHGNCVSVGCVPISDDKIKELYLLAVEAKNNGQHQIPVHFFPYKMNEVKEISSHKVLWCQLQLIYHFFEKHKTIPKVKVDSEGNYYI